MSNTATPRERELLGWIARWWDKYGGAPSFRELQAAMGVNDVCQIREFVEHLAAKGLVIRGKRYERRALRVSEEGKAVLASE